MLRLYGAPLSPFFNKVKLALLEKNLPFECILTRPTQETSLLARSPMGKIPFIENDDGLVLAESQAICEWVDEAYPERPLLLGTPAERARIRELALISELYISNACARLYRHVLFGEAVSTEEKTDIRAKIARGVTALSARMQGPFLAGDYYSLADVTAIAHLPPVQEVVQHTLGIDPFLAAPALSNWLTTLLARPHVAQVHAERRAFRDQFLARSGKKR